MSRGWSSKTCQGQVPNFLPKQYFHDKHGPLNPDVEVLASQLAVPLSGARRGPPAGLLRGSSMANGLILDAAPSQAGFYDLNLTNDLLGELADEPGMRRHFSIKISAITRNIRQRRCNCQRSVRQRINRHGRQGGCEYFLKKLDTSIDYAR